MFENFSFDSPRSPSVASSNTVSTMDEPRSVSPCTPLAAMPAPPLPYSITDLAAAFGQQHLRQNSDIYSQSCEAYANQDDDAGWAIVSDVVATELPSTTRARSMPARSYSPTGRRAERQANARLLCSASHHRDIATLVTHMINQQEQCLITPPTSIPEALQTGDADAYYDDITADEFAPLERQSSTRSIIRSREYRRPSDLRKPGSSICKAVRSRKERPRRQKSDR